MISHYLSQLFSLNLLSDRFFRAGSAALFSMLFVLFCMPAFIRWVNKRGMISDFTSAKEKAPPIFGGLILVCSVTLSALIFSRINGYSLSILLILLAYSAVGFVDDYFKVANKKKVDANELSKKSFQDKADGISTLTRLSLYLLFSVLVAVAAYKLIPNLNRHLQIPFVKPSSFYPLLPNWLYLALMVFVVTAMANGANFTDGIDSLVSVPLITNACFVGLVAYISGNKIFSEYLLLPYIPGVDELLPICAAIAGSLLAYLCITLHQRQSIWVTADLLA